MNAVKPTPERIAELSDRIMVPVRPQFVKALAVAARAAEDWVASVYATYQKQWETSLVQQRATYNHVYFASGTGPPIRDPIELWETYAAEGVIPFDWIDHPVRRFNCCCVSLYRTAETRNALTCKRCNNTTEPQPYPGTWEQALLVASDVTGVQAAEERVRELFPDDRISWRMRSPAIEHRRDIIDAIRRGAYREAELGVFDTGYTCLRLPWGVMIDDYGIW